MIVICEECGKKYRIDASKIQGREARFKCKSCKSVIKVSKPEIPSTASQAPPPEPVEMPASDGTRAVDPVPSPPREPEPSLKKAKKSKKPSRSRIDTGISPVRKKRGMGIRLKMVFLFLLIPLAIIAVASYLFLKQLNFMSDSLIQESSALVTEMSESIIAETARSAAGQCRLYLDSHPGLNAEYFAQNDELERLAQKKVGQTGYTFLFSLPDEGRPSTIWIHPKKDILGESLSSVMKKELGGFYPQFDKILKALEKGEAVEAKGYFTQKDKAGKVREKFIAMSPIEGSDFIVAANTYIDEFTLPVLNLEKAAQRTTDSTRNYIIAILLATVILIGLIVTLYGHRLSGKIKSLTDIANRISVGELDEEIKVKATDEIGDLAEAISRMQDSIRLSIERLRRRR